MDGLLVLIHPIFQLPTIWPWTCESSLIGNTVCPLAPYFSSEVMIGLSSTRCLWSYEQQLSMYHTYRTGHSCMTSMTCMLICLVSYLTHDWIILVCTLDSDLAIIRKEAAGMTLLWVVAWMVRLCTRPWTVIKAGRESEGQGTNLRWNITRLHSRSTGICLILFMNTPQTYVICGVIM